MQFRGQRHFRTGWPRMAIAAGLLCLSARAADVASLLGSDFMVWFPPAVPATGDAILNAARPPRYHPRLEPPPGLADFVNEAFYPPLSTRLHANAIGRGLVTRLAGYQSTRATLLNELADFLVELHGTDDNTRLERLKSFAGRQTPRIVVLEREAEELRRALIDGRLLQRSVDWSRSRRWFLGETRFPHEQVEKEAQFQVVRAAAFYQDGLSIEQRGLLREIADELRQRAIAARPVGAPRRGDPSAMYFSPATARMRMPRQAPPDLVARFARYNREKVALKDELRDAVFAQDRNPREQRAAAFEALADAQWPRLVELEKLADEIRAALAVLPPASQAAPPHIPPGLMARINAYNSDRRKYLDEYEQTLRVADSLVTIPRVDQKTPEDVRIELARKVARQRADLRATVSESFQKSTRERFEAMRARYDEIRADLELVAVGQLDPETGRPLNADTLMRAYTNAMDRFDALGREEVIYRGYRMAMLMPGLSSEQRRLLFGAALVGLAQPLPLGEPLPTGLQPAPRS